MAVIVNFNFPREIRSAQPRRLVRSSDGDTTVIEQPIRMVSCDTPEKSRDAASRRSASRSSISAASASRAGFTTRCRRHFATILSRGSPTLRRSGTSRPGSARARRSASFLRPASPAPMAPHEASATIPTGEMVRLPRPDARVYRSLVHRVAVRSAAAAERPRAANAQPRHDRHGLGRLLPDLPVAAKEQRHECRDRRSPGRVGRQQGGVDAAERPRPLAGLRIPHVHQARGVKKERRKHRAGPEPKSAGFHRRSVPEKLREPADNDGGGPVRIPRRAAVGAIVVLVDGPQAGAATPRSSRGQRLSALL